MFKGFFGSVLCKAFMLYTKNKPCLLIYEGGGCHSQAGGGVYQHFCQFRSKQQFVKRQIDNGVTVTGRGGGVPDVTGRGTNPRTSSSSSPGLTL